MMRTALLPALLAVTLARLVVGAVMALVAFGVFPHMEKLDLSSAAAADGVPELLTGTGVVMLCVFSSDWESSELAPEYDEESMGLARVSIGLVISATAPLLLAGSVYTLNLVVSLMRPLKSSIELGGRAVDRDRPPCPSPLPLLSSRCSRLCGLAAVEPYRCGSSDTLCSLPR